jgi:regulator of CtrA degradation
MNELQPINVAPARANVVRGFAGSELFERIFQEGMELVEATAAYLDGSGRQDSKMLSRNAALAYAKASMRLTTRLMQVASWLLVQRAVREGDMTAAEACENRYRLSPSQAPGAPPADDEAGAEPLPETLIELIDRAEKLCERVAHLDRRMYLDPPTDETEHPVLSQFDRLRAAFGAAG